MTEGGYAIKANFDAACPPADLLRWLRSTEGISGWWSDTVGGAAGSAGDTFSVRFPTTPVVFELDVSEAGERVVEWLVQESPPWWKGTTIRFEISEGEVSGSTFTFTHEGFDPDDPIIPVITPAWVRFLDNLVAVAESGKPRPAVVN